MVAIHPGLTRTLLVMTRTLPVLIIASGLCPDKAFRDGKLNRYQTLMIKRQMC